MHAGELDRRIKLQYATEARDTTGQSVRTWKDIGNVWAKVVEEAGSESNSDSQVVGSRVVTVTIRYLRGIKSETMRMQHEGRWYDIRSTQEQGRRAWLQMSCVSTTEGEQG